MKKIIAFLNYLANESNGARSNCRVKQIINFIKNSNHYKHLIGGFIVSWLTASPYAGIYAAVVAATCLELKDRLYGNKFDLTEWLLTVAGGAIAAVIWLII